MTVTESSTSDAGAGRGPTADDPSSARSLHHITVVTPEGVVLEFRAAGVASRMLAIVIDVVIQYILLFVLIIMAAVTAAVSPTLGVIFIFVMVFMVFWGYPTLLETFWNGRTVGKRVFGLRVLTIEGGPVGFRQASIRALLGLVDFWLPVPGGMVALVSALTTKNSQRLGDLAAGTIVVREPKDTAPSFFFNPVVGAEAYGLTLDASLLQPDHYALAREFLVRAPDLMPGPRATLGTDLADRLAAVTGTARPPELGPEQYLQSLLFANQRQTRELENGMASMPTSAPRPAPVARPAPTSLASTPPPTGAPVVGLGDLPPPTGAPVAADPPRDDHYRP